MMSLHVYLHQRGILDTQAEADNSLRQVLAAKYGPMMPPANLLANNVEFRRFCEHLRQQWLIDAPNEMIQRALQRLI